MKTESTRVLTLIPDEGMMLFDGENYSDKVYVREDLAENWTEVPYEQYEQWKAEEEARQREEQERMERESRGEDPEGETETESSEETQAEDAEFEEMPSENE